MMQPTNMEEQKDSTQALAARFAELPKVVQDAITSADVQKHLRDLAEIHKLHVDQWQVLENNVMLTLLGFQPVAELPNRLAQTLNVPAELAAEIATNISSVVFTPIRAEMERALDNPSAKPAAVSTIETVRAQEMQGAAPDTTTVSPVQSAPATTPAAPIQPATPPMPAPEEKAVRAQISNSYSSSPSHERKSIEGDPYREQLS